MQNKLELIIPFNKSNIRIGLVFFPCVAACYVIIFHLVSALQNSVFYCFVLLFQALCVMFAAAFLLGFIYCLYFQIKIDVPAAIINQDGFWIKDFGLIPWQNIDSVDIFVVPTVPIESISVKVKNTRQLYKSASFTGKIRVVNSKLFGYPAIIIANIELDNYQVIRFARQFLYNQEKG